MAKILDHTQILATKTSDGKIRRLECDDNGNLKVLPQGAAGGDGAILDGVTSSIRATVKDYPNSNPQSVELVDTNGDPVSAGGGTQYDEDTPHVSGDKLTMAGVVQKSADAALSGDGDRSLLQVDATGWLKVAVKTTAGLTDTQLRASAVPVSVPIPVPVSDNAGSLTVDAPVGTPVWSRLSNGLAALIGQQNMAASIPVVVASDQSALDVSDRAARLLGVIAASTNRLGSVRIVDSADADQTTVKGTQTSRFLGTQDAKDSGRVNKMFTFEFAFAQTAETILTVTTSNDGAANSTFTSYTYPSGKRLRITSVSLEAEHLGTGTTVPQRCYLRLRNNNGGAATAASPLQGVWGVAAEPPAILKTAAWGAWSFPDGIEYLGDGTKSLCFTLETPDWVVTTQTGRAKGTITAFEY